MVNDGMPVIERCAAGPDGCDRSDDEMVRCTVCGAVVCDFHGEYADEAAHAEGDWRCPQHTEAMGYAR